ncbi:oligosaccharide flippase family protein [Conexibacter woesei]|uniref:oligosaccharide flippase family protein n=1 Tax=Conexibacter woesei TaxID=191495 RepID=UPI00041D5ADD|nr:oligosaccharide flippase family protein [Conexibacter woesei]
MTADRSSVDVLDTPEAGALVVRGGAVRVLGFALGTVLSLGGVVAVTRHLGVVDYGRYQSVTALVAIVTALGDLGLGTLALREFAQADASSREHALDALLGLRVALAVVGVCVSAGAAAVLGYDGAMVAGAALASGAGVLLAGQQTATVPLQTALRIGTVTALDVARQAATTALMLCGVAAGAGVLTFLAIPVPVAVLLVVLTAAALRGTRRPRPRADRTLWPRLLREAVLVGLATASGVLYLYASLIVCGLATSEHQTGAFSASFRVIIIVAAVPALLGTSAFPLLARTASSAPERFGRAVSGLIEGSVLLGGVAAIGAILGAPAIIAVIAGSGFDDSIAPLRIQGAALGLTFAISGLGFALLARHRQRVLLVCNLLVFVVSAVAVALLAHAHGARGAALGAAIGEATLCAAYALALTRGAPGIHPSRVPRIVLALAGGLAAGALIPVPAVPATILGLLVYGALAYLLRAIPPGLRALVR